MAAGCSASAWRATRSRRAGACAGGSGDVELARPGAPERVPSFSKEGLKPLVGPVPARGWAGALRRLCRRAPAAEQAARAGSAADPGPLGGGGGRGAGGGVARQERRPNMLAAEAAAVAAFRAALERIASNSATAVSEWYLGAWHGRHWCARGPCLARAAWLGGAYDVFGVNVNTQLALPSIGGLCAGGRAPTCDGSHWCSAVHDENTTLMCVPVARAGTCRRSRG